MSQAAHADKTKQNHREQNVDPFLAGQVERRGGQESQQAAAELIDVLKHGECLQQ